MKKLLLATMVTMLAGCGEKVQTLEESDAGSTSFTRPQMDLAQSVVPSGWGVPHPDFGECQGTFQDRCSLGQNCCDGVCTHSITGARCCNGPGMACTTVAECCNDGQRYWDCQDNKCCVFDKGGWNCQ